MTKRPILISLTSAALVLGGVTACGQGSQTPGGTDTGTTQAPTTLDPTDTPSTVLPPTDPSTESSTTGIPTAAPTTGGTPTDPGPMSFDVTFEETGGIDGRSNIMTVTAEGLVEYGDASGNSATCRLDPKLADTIQQAARDAKVVKTPAPSHTGHPMSDQIFTTVRWGDFTTDWDNPGVSELLRQTQPIFGGLRQAVVGDDDPCALEGLSPVK